MATCYRHPGRETGVSCSNCERPICPDCMTTSPVGMRCPECARQTTKVDDRLDAEPSRLPGDDRADHHQRHRLPLGGSGVFSLTGATGQLVAAEPRVARRALRAPTGVPRRSRPPVLPAADERLPASRLPAHRLEHVRPLLGRAAARAGDRRSRFLALYFTGLLAGSLGVIIVSPLKVTAGASGPSSR